MAALAADLGKNISCHHSCAATPVAPAAESHLCHPCTATALGTHLPCYGCGSTWPFMGLAPVEAKGKALIEFTGKKIRPFGFKLKL